MIRAGVAGSLQDGVAKRKHLESILKQSPEFAGLIAQDLFAHYTESGEAAAGLDLLHAHYQQYPSLDLFNVVFRAMRAQQNATSAWAFARASLESHPSLLGLDRFLEAELAQAEQENGDSAAVQVAVPGADLLLLRSLINRHTQRLDRYVCRSCGFQARRYYWQCPGCNAWETYKPRRLEELE
jgi:lipopolysaccharide biosynthesis regulator YciM